MRTLKLLTMLLVFAIVVNANQNSKKLSHMMNQGMKKIQYGFIINDKESILKGIKQINKGNKLCFDKYSKQKQKNRSIEKIFNIIKINTEMMKISLKEQEYYDASKRYNQVLNSCAKCHNIMKNRSTAQF